MGSLSIRAIRFVHFNLNVSCTQYTSIICSCSLKSKYVVLVFIFIVLLSVTMLRLHLGWILLFAGVVPIVDGLLILRRISLLFLEILFFEGKNVVLTSRRNILITEEEDFVVKLGVFFLFELLQILIRTRSER
jgi:hypothetical protein